MWISNPRRKKYPTVLSLLNGQIINQIYQKVFDYNSRQTKKNDKERMKENSWSRISVSQKAILSGLNCGDTMTIHTSNGIHDKCKSKFTTHAHTLSNPFFGILLKTDRKVTTKPNGNRIKWHEYKSDWIYSSLQRVTFDMTHQISTIYKRFSIRLGELGICDFTFGLCCCLCLYVSSPLYLCA